MTIRELWRSITPGRYVQALEAEVSRLRAENRALLNSILGIAGVPPVTVPVADVHGFETELAADEKAAETIRPRAASRSAMQAAQMATPTRRRSWQQIMRTWELESAGKKETTGPESAPPGIARKK